MIIKSKKNPIIPGMGVCDPHMHVFENKVWLYTSHDAIPGSSSFCMHDWQVWSSEDCVEWKLEAVVRPEDTFMGPSSECWAVDCVERNGKYYFYFSECNRRTGVLVGDSPAGPFRDVLGKPLLDGTLTTTTEYDPSVFRDDDGEYYIAFGGPKWCYGEGAGYYIARLNEDMISLAESPRPIELDHKADDKISLNKFNGKYYLSFGGFYAISDSVYGPYKYMGHNGASIDHTSYCEWNGQLFHTITVNDYYGSYRASGICYAHIRDNGHILVDPIIKEYGVGQYDSDWNHIQAEWFMAGKNAKKVENNRLYVYDMFNGFAVLCKENAVLIYPKIRNLSDKAGMIFSAVYGSKGTVEVREGSEQGRLIGIASIHEELNGLPPGVLVFDEPLADVTDICLVVKPEPGSEVAIDYFHFFAQAIENP